MMGKYFIILIIHGTFNYYELFIFLRNLVIGLHGGLYLGVGVCWFIYTLVILKVIYQYCPNSYFFYLLGGLLLGIAYIYNHLDLSGIFTYKLSNSIVNVCTAYPFFAIGVYAKNYRDYCNMFKNKAILGLVLIICIFVVYLCEHYNEHIWMDCCDYGSNLFLFLLGGIAGSICIFVLSKFMGHASKAVTIISRGTILILGFHMPFVKLLRQFFNVSFLDFIFAAIILLVFIPIILFAERFFPLIIGKYRMKQRLTSVPNTQE